MVDASGMHPTRLAFLSFALNIVAPGHAQFTRERTAPRRGA
jgi:hypothetical protein